MYLRVNLPMLLGILMLGLLTACGTKIAQEEEQVIGCAQCEFGCADGVCRACDTGPCCSDGMISPEGTVCEGSEYQVTETQCQGSGCGDQWNSRTLSRACDGKTAECNGVLVAISDWKTEATCDQNSVCDKDSGCVPCGKICSSGTCVECITGSCCDSQTSTLRPAGTKCNITIGYYCAPFGCGGKEVQVQTFYTCDGTVATCPGDSSSDNAVPSVEIVGEYQCSKQQRCIGDGQGNVSIESDPTCGPVL
jgi:hypothetical protein